MLSAAMHQFCRLLLQNSAVEDGKTLANLRNHENKTPHMKSMVFVAGTQADIIWHEAPKSIDPAVHKLIWETKEQGDIEKARRQRFINWWMEDAGQQGTRYSQQMRPSAQGCQKIWIWTPKVPAPAKMGQQHRSRHNSKLGEAPANISSHKQHLL